ncbi:MAG: hypothetical protein N3B21_00950 [Clostridia bacterium]|nr:hypothetical protein [Clostridia bacterium]
MEIGSNSNFKYFKTAASKSEFLNFANSIKETSKYTTEVSDISKNIFLKYERKLLYKLTSFFVDVVFSENKSYSLISVNYGTNKRLAYLRFSILILLAVYTGFLHNPHNKLIGIAFWLTYVLLVIAESIIYSMGFNRFVKLLNSSLGSLSLISEKDYHLSLDETE